MRTADTHLSDEQLLQFADGELPSGQTAGVNQHLASCWECRTRLKQLEETIADFVTVHHGALDPQLPPAAGPRALLKARLAQSAATTPPATWLQTLQRGFALRRFAYAGAMLLAAVVGAIVLYRALSPPRTPNRMVRAEPDPRLTPGAVRAVSASDICATSYSDDTSQVAAAVQETVLREYGIRGKQPQGYELDYLISPQLGGTDDVRNLWLEPESSTAWDARAKDALENRLYQLVCQGKINVATAQRDLATDWISAYKRYFHTDRPLEPL